MNPSTPHKKLLTLAVTSAIAAGAPASAALAADAPADAPNIVVVLIDDMGYSDLGVFGAEIQTPNLDALANDGTILSNFYAAPTSTPARAMLFTGRDSHQVGIGNMTSFMRDEQRGMPNYEGALSHEAETIPEVLSENGYHTMMSGKWDLGEARGEYASDHGFARTEGLLIFGGDVQFLSTNDGSLITSFPQFHYDALDNPNPTGGTSGNNDGVGRVSGYNRKPLDGPVEDITSFPPNAYAATYYTDSAMAMIDEYRANDAIKDKPFYLSVKHIAAHFPLQAPPEVYEKYISLYSQGWDVIREARFEKLKAQGLIPADATVPPRPSNVQAWETLSDKEKRFQTKKMAVYAAMVEIVDSEFGRLTNYLQQIGEYDDTVFIVMSDNGGAFRVTGGNTPPGRGADRAARFIVEADLQAISDDTNLDTDQTFTDIGAANSYLGFGFGWSMVSNAPFNRTKGSTYEGGVHTAAIVHYPKLATSLPKSDCIYSIMDIAPTVLEMAAGSGNPSLANADIQGVSFANLFRGTDNTCQERSIGWELDGVKGLRSGDWKLSQIRNVEEFALFNLADDPFEQNDLSTTNPAQFQAMLAKFAEYVQENSVIEVSNKKLRVTDQVDSTNAATNAVLTAGVTKKGSAVYQLSNNFSTSDNVELIAYIRPDPAHVGQTADIFTTITHTSPTGQNTFLAVTESGLVAQDTAEGLPSFKTGTLGTTQYIPAASQTFPPGTVSMSFGYRLENGQTITNKNAVTANVTGGNTGGSSGLGSADTFLLFLLALLLPFSGRIARQRKQR